MAAKLKLIPGSTIRWGARRFVVVDYVGLDAVIAREVGKRKLCWKWTALSERLKKFRRLLMPWASIRPPLQGKSRFVGHSEHWCCNQRRLSIRFAKEGRRRGSPQSHRRPQPSENHNRPAFSFANSALLFAFNSLP